MTGAEVRKLKDEEIDAEIARLREKLYRLRTQTVTEKVEDLSQFTKTRRDVARLIGERHARRLKSGQETARPRGKKRRTVESA